MTDESGWSWYAEVSENLYAWVRVAPRHLANVRSVENFVSSAGADVTWRLADRLAGPGFFLVGDAGMPVSLLNGSQYSGPTFALRESRLIESRRPKNSTAGGSPRQISRNPQRTSFKP